MLMQNDLINTAKVTYGNIAALNEWLQQLVPKFSTIIDFDKDNEHYEVGIFKTLYRLRPSKSSGDQSNVQIYHPQRFPDGRGSD